MTPMMIKLENLVSILNKCLKYTKDDLQHYSAIKEEYEEEYNSLPFWKR